MNAILPILFLLVVVTAQQPSPRIGATQVIYDNTIVTFGGYATTADKKSYSFPSDQFWRYDLDALSYYQPTTYGIQPAPRVHHGVALWYAQMLIWGGEVHNGTIDSGRTGLIMDPVMYSFNFFNDTWSIIPNITNVPAPRSNFAFAQHHDELILTGGTNEPLESLMLDNSIWRYSAPDNTWTQAVMETGVFPCFYNAAGAVFEGAFYIYGGAYTLAPNSGSYLSTRIYRVDLVSYAWSKLDTATYESVYHPMWVRFGPWLYAYGGRLQTADNNPSKQIIRLNMTDIAAGFELVGETADGVTQGNLIAQSNMLTLSFGEGPNNVMSPVLPTNLTWFDADCEYFSTFRKCQPCAAGWGGLLQGPGCGQCAQGFASDWNSVCQNCYQGVAPGNTPARCDICPPGTEPDNQGVVGAYECATCPPGYSVSYPQFQCGICPAGMYSGPAPSGRCLYCPNGTYSDGSGFVECTPCPRGTICTLASTVPMNQSSYGELYSQQPQFVPKTALIQQYQLYIWGFGLGSVVLLNLVLMCCLRSSAAVAKSFQTKISRLDLFNQRHSNPIPGPILQRRTAFGGLLSIGYLMGMCVMLAAVILQYRLTVIGTQSLVPGFATTTITSAVSIRISVGGTSQSCTSVATDVQYQSLSYQSITPELSVDQNWCNVTLQCGGCSIGNALTAGVSFVARNVTAQLMMFELRSSTYDSEQPSVLRGTIQASDNAVIGGATPSTLGVSLFQMISNDTIQNVINTGHQFAPLTFSKGSELTLQDLTNGVRENANNVSVQIQIQRPTLHVLLIITPGGTITELIAQILAYLTGAFSVVALVLLAMERAALQVGCSGKADQMPLLKSDT